MICGCRDVCVIGSAVLSARLGVRSVCVHRQAKIAEIVLKRMVIFLESQCNRRGNL